MNNRNNKQINFDMKTRRKELGLTLEQVGNFVGVGKSTVKKWETGFIDNMKRDKIAMLAKVLQVSPLTIIGVKDDANVDMEFLSPSDEGITLYNKLDAEDKAEVRGTMKQMLKAGKYQHNTDIAVVAKKTPTKPEVKKKPKNT